MYHRNHAVDEGGQLPQLFFDAPDIDLTIRWAFSCRDTLRYGLGNHTVHHGGSQKGL